MTANASLWRALRESIVKAAKDKVGEIAIGLVVIALGFAWYKLQSAAQAVRNISAEDAWRMARAQIGNQTVAVLPFRNVGGKDQLVAAVVRSDPDSTIWHRGSRTPALPSFRIFLIHHLDSEGYQVVDTTMGLSRWGDKSDPDQTNEKPFGVVNIDARGCKLVFAIDISSGSGGQSATARLFDSCLGVEYVLAVEPDYSSNQLDIQPTANLKDKPEYVAWMKKKSRELFSPRTVSSSTNEEVEQWRGLNGADFQNGVIQLEENRGPIPDQREPLCQIDDGTDVWTAYFKGALYRYDKVRKSHALIFVSESEYNYVRELTISKHFVWFANYWQPIRVVGDVMAFDKQSHVLKSVKMSDFPDSEFADARGCPGSDGVPERSPR